MSWVDPEDANGKQPPSPSGWALESFLVFKNNRTCLAVAGFESTWLFVMNFSGQPEISPINFCS